MLRFIDYLYLCISYLLALFHTASCFNRIEERTNLDRISCHKREETNETINKYTHRTKLKRSI